ncbi:hypothetical protein L6164_027754 [Bauhinia variegata]|uniref:Uncharacterized protein n=1 Tax=Bauhinia variegata TaxID=167791 RepID=A0ACB9LUA8_BAUVA|nr:hypothetical protein L6164_027754 [Bauhinia variegata]
MISMAVSILPFPSHALFFALILFSISHISTQSSGTNFSCPADEASVSPCDTYVTYFAKSPNLLSLTNISDLFGISPLSIARASNLTEADSIQLIPGQLLLVPVSCGCTGNRSFANNTYEIKSGDNYFFVSTTLFENLTNWHVVEELNPSLNPNLLQIGVKVVFPLFCRCPSKQQLAKGITNLITYVWQPSDNVALVSAKFNASATDIMAENNYQNFTSAVYQPLFIPVTQLPDLSLPPSNKTKHNNPFGVILGVSLGCTLLIALLATSLVYLYCLRKKKTTLDSNDSSLEQAHKLLIGVSGYVSKPTIYNFDMIMEVTMNLSEQRRIGGSVYRAKIDDQILAVKKIKEDVTEELKILLRVNHANLVKLMGVSSDNEGNCFLVYEYAENGSLDNLLYSKSPATSNSLTWNQRICIALDVALGLQYLHEHIQPRIVHRDISTRNILLDSKLKAKISNFSMARTSTSTMMPKIDVFSFGVVLLELLTGQKSMRTNESGETILLWKDIRGIFDEQENKEDRLKGWMDPKLKSFYPIDDALNLANLAVSCTAEKNSSRPTMAEIVLSLSLHTQSTPARIKGSPFGLDAEVPQPIAAR